MEETYAAISQLYFTNSSLMSCDEDQSSFFQAISPVFQNCLGRISTHFESKLPDSIQNSAKSLKLGSQDTRTKASTV